MSDILTGKIEKPPGITIDQRPPRQIDNFIYYVAPFISNMDFETFDCWKCIGGVHPLGSVKRTNKWMSSAVRNDLHCWLHSDDKDIGPSLKKCVIAMDEIRVQLDKCVEFGSNTTQVGT